MRRTQYEVYYKPLSPLAIIGLVALGVAFFFLTLPIFLAAVAVFSAVAAYFAWRIKRTMREMEKEIMRQQQDASCRHDDSGVIDITPEPGEEPGRPRSRR